MNTDEIIGTALLVPYLPGGRGLAGWDCYGSVRWAYYQLTGVLMPEYPAISHAENQATQKAAWSVHDHVEECSFQPLAFAAQYHGKRWVHIGLVLPDRTILHAYEGRPTTEKISRNQFELMKPVTKYYRWVS
jgi:cell wall-associated NlpC family hydrolase